ncbi:MAG: hypothetical protein E6G67_09530 [Actinobacteria bacterium]|nr:MAG: hypothetical protein E6G67_09530 [Actinomycetota bacterium]
MDVEASVERIRELGGTVTDGPAEFPQYRKGYYAVFFEDPDGLKLEIVSFEHAARG